MTDDSPNLRGEDRRSPGASTDQAEVPSARGRRARRRPERATDPAVARASMERVARTLGVAVIVNAVEPGPPTTIQALLIYPAAFLGRAQETVTVSAGTEARAWRKLAAGIVAWRRSDAMAITWWVAGGG